MRWQSWRKALWSQVRGMALIMLGVAVAVGIICLLAGWRTLTAYGGGLVAGGTLVIVLGAMFGYGARGVVGGGTYQTLRTVQPRRGHYDPVRDDQRYIDDSILVFLKLFLTGAVLIALGEFVRRVLA